jgi:hypothetical protein
MSTRRTALSLGALALLACVALFSAQVALAIFNKSVTGGPLTIATASFSPPSAVAATQVNCRTNKNPEVSVEWSATSSTYATSYTVERATASAGPYTALSSVAIDKTSYTDTSAALTYSTTYYYRVSAVYHSWTATSASASVKTLSKLCL